MSDKLVLVKLIVLAITVLAKTQRFDILKTLHSAGDLENNEIRLLATLQNEQQLVQHLNTILVPRVVGSEGHTKVYNYLKKSLEEVGYQIEVDEFVDKTPFGNKTFRNIIATLNPAAERFFVIAAHYDSKYFGNQLFVGATDSAVSCGMMLEMARVFKNFTFPTKNDVSLKFIFFDGEEAFVQWGPKDSIYGARHLAQKLHQNQSLSRLTGERVSGLQRIDCLMLLDLLGAADPTIFNYFQETRGWFNLLSDAERRLSRLGLLKKRSIVPYFHKRTRTAAIEDDHIPFLRKGVPVLHIIPLPFPDAWHTIYDNADTLDPDTIYDLSFTLQLFVAQYLHL